jgi:hypothetical protein
MVTRGSGALALSVAYRPEAGIGDYMATSQSMFNLIQVPPR